MKYTRFPIRIEPVAVTVRYRDGRLTLHLPDAIDPDGLTAVKLRKIFRLFIERRLDFLLNEESLMTLDSFIADYVLACKDAADLAAEYYEQNKRDQTAIIGNTKDARSKRKAIRERNAELLREIKSTKKTYQHSKKN